MNERIHTIVVVDDDDDTRETLQEILEREGYDVRVASHGEEALAQLKACGGRCIVILDLLMPEMDGWEFLEEQLSLAGSSSRPVIIISGAVDAREADRMPGVVKVLVKPFDPQDLLEAVDELSRPVGEKMQRASTSER